MKRLYFVRHAKSGRDNPRLPDKLRPLNERGKKDTRRMAGRLKKKKIKPQVIYSSPALRARETAEGIAGKIGFPREKIKIIRSMYKANIPKLMKVIKNIDDNADTAMLFGHNPEFLNIVNYLTPSLIKEFPACGVFGIDFDVRSWGKIRRGKGKAAFFDFPGG